MILFLILAVLVLSSKYWFPGLIKFSSPAFVRDYFIGLGTIGYIIFIGLIAASIILPVPSTFVAIGGGYVYGLLIGTILALAGTILGATVSFYLVRIFGEPLLEKVVSKKNYLHFNHLFKKRGTKIALISYALPIFPADSLNFLLGLTNIKYAAFLVILILGSIPRYVIVTSLGENLLAGITIKSAITVGAAVIFILIALFRERIKLILFKELKEIEREVEKEVRKDVEKAEKEVKIVEKAATKEVKFLESEFEKEIKNNKRKRRN